MEKAIIPHYHDHVMNNRKPSQITNHIGMNTTGHLLAAIAGSILIGIGLGIIFRFRGSTGGTDIPVMVIKKYTNLPITAGYLIAETGIIVTIGLTIGVHKSKRH
jgi:uncharacterized membrane-anchored protein YitT (DUF2179 family)